MNLTQSKDGKKEVVSNNENVCVDRHDFNDDLSLSSNSDVRSSERKVFPLQGKNSTNEHVRDKLIEEESNLDQPAPVLLYLHNNMSLDDENKTIDFVKMAKDEGIGIILAHEQDLDKGSCPFGLIIDKTNSEVLASDCHSTLNER